MEVISAWEIYWVMQLDSIGMGMSIMSVMGLAVVFGAWTLASEVEAAWAFLLAGAVTIGWLCCIVLAIFLPSTKTAAAMFIVPKLANNQAIQAEAGELYALAKDALRKAVADDKPAKEVE